MEKSRCEKSKTSPDLTTQRNVGTTAPSAVIHYRFIVLKFIIFNGAEIFESRIS